MGEGDAAVAFAVFSGSFDASGSLKMSATANPVATELKLEVGSDL